MGAAEEAEGEPPLHMEDCNLEAPGVSDLDVVCEGVVDETADDLASNPLPGTPPDERAARLALTAVPLHPRMPVCGDEDEDELALCIVCYEQPSGTSLDPCGHDHFCLNCAAQFRTCPLCRAPLVPRGALPGTVARPSLLSSSERCNLAWLAAFVYGIIFIGGYIENCYGIPGGGGGNDPDDQCVECFGTGWGRGGRGGSGDGGRSDCRNESLLQAGAGCYAELEDIPAVQTGAALGGSTYFVLIIMTQALGMACEIFLIRRLLRRNLLPRKELFILSTALFIEVSRMLLVDIFVLRDYFSGRSYRIFRAPLPCDSGDGWCTETGPASPDARYFYGVNADAFSADPSRCTTFGADSALLDYDHYGTWNRRGGHQRFTRIGWVVGGEFALYYFFATFINEVADNLFVVPTTTSNGWKCKAFSIALEMFQLGALCPAAIFNHWDCLHYTDPLGVSLHLIRGVIVAFGYSIWAFMFTCLPLALAGSLVFGLLYFISMGALRPLECCCGNNCLRTTEARLRALKDALLGATSDSCGSLMYLAFFPLFFGGVFLGTLVVVGQGSKEGAMQILTAVVLLSDVLFKVGATLITEGLEYALHRRVVQRAAQAQAALGIDGDASTSMGSRVAGTAVREDAAAP